MQRSVLLNRTVARLATGAAVAAALALVCAVGCGGDAASGDEAGGAGGAAIGDDGAAADSAADAAPSADADPDAGADAGGKDAAGSPDEGGADGMADAPAGDADAGPKPDPYFALGSNVTGEATPASFHELHDGDELAIEYGAQGLWMVVLAFRTRDLFEGRLTLIARISVGDDELGQFGIAKQETVDGGDGFDYYYNFFLVVDDETVTGQVGHIELSIKDDVGTEFETTLDVLLTGGFVEGAGG